MSTISTGSTARSGERRERGAEPSVAEQSRVQAADELANLLQRERQLVLGRLDQCRHLAGVGLEPPPDQLEVERDGDESLLRPVVQVALDAPPLGVSRCHQPGARLLQLARYFVQIRDVADDRDDFVLGGGRDSNLEVAILTEMGPEPVLDRREPAGLERRADARHQLLRDLRWEHVADRRADDHVRRIREARDITGDLEVGAVRPQPQQQIGKRVEQRLEARLNRGGDRVHSFIVDGE